MMMGLPEKLLRNQIGKKQKFLMSIKKNLVNFNKREGKPFTLAKNKTFFFLEKRDKFVDKK